MNNRIIKIAITLAMLLMIAAPAQVFAAENNSDCGVTINGKPLTGTYEQFIKQFNNFGIKLQPPQQASAPTAKAQAPADRQKAVPAKAQAPVTRQEAAPVKQTAVPDKTAAETPVAAPDNTAAETPAAGSIGAYEQQVVDLVNQERAAAGLPALKVNAKLSGVAEKKAEDLRDNNYFDHQSPTYGSPFDMMKQFGIQYTTAGENIAKGQRTPAEVMNGWMNSPGHRANILNADFTEIGVGYVTDSNGGTYWVQHFIRP